METVKYHKQGDVAIVQFHRPTVRNAVNQQMMSELEQLLLEWEQDSQIKIIIFRGDTNAFVSGGDLEEFHQLHTCAEIEPIMKRMGGILERIYQLPVLTIARIEGPAVGGGCEIAMSCDWVVANDHATLGMIQVRLGITTGWGGAVRLMKKVGISTAMKILLSGKRYSAREGMELGMIDFLLGEEDQSFDDPFHDWLQPYTKLSRDLISHYKKLAKRVEKGASSTELFELEAKKCGLFWETEEHRLAVDSFLIRRGR
ncbi:enoyl-CoA hydratase/isomerase family protein [Thermoactinomyces sp. DSM 45892]|uniref:enoyl-CoA hydratase/isomerase family protein n=1 Tax=Thermoactinomyces sp. DSM 45892 TaxID=1882753 RepID=UPI00089B9E55|nr:enoyl-CoA hydratase/isomerase family protein [Thermoactinomyces sp. DSM 45892]SDY61430.1 Enoyl-CoA hydratase/carnithine racemase [Thermoactinomyces sp. DSM 45892]